MDIDLDLSSGSRIYVRGGLRTWNPNMKPEPSHLLTITNVHTRFFPIRSRTDGEPIHWVLLVKFLNCCQYIQNMGSVNGPLYSILPPFSGLYICLWPTKVRKIWGIVWTAMMVLKLQPLTENEMWASYSTNKMIVEAQMPKYKMFIQLYPS